MNPIKIYQPVTPGLRKATSVLYRGILTKKKPERALIVGKKRLSGRSRAGQITTRHRGGGAKKLYRLVDFKQQKFGIPGKVRSLEYDPNRSAFIALIVFADGAKSYILAPQNLKVGDRIIYNPSTKVKVGNRMQLKNIPAGTPIHNIELLPGQGGKLVRSAGSSAQIMSFDRDYALLKMPSTELRLVPAEAYASIGVVSNPDHANIRLGKAGRVRHLGRRPEVRGKVMSPRDHPHGGGEGRNPIGLKAPKTKWGKKAFGVRTRPVKKYSDKFIVRRRSKKKRKQ